MALTFNLNHLYRDIQDLQDFHANYLPGVAEQRLSSMLNRCLALQEEHMAIAVLATKSIEQTKAFEDQLQNTALRIAKAKAWLERAFKSHTLPVAETSVVVEEPEATPGLSLQLMTSIAQAWLYLKPF